MAEFWKLAGVGVSSRFAEANLAHLQCLRAIPILSCPDSRPGFDGPSLDTLRESIIACLKRAPLHKEAPRPSATDVYLYPSGMASVYRTHMYMSEHYQGTTVLFGVTFVHTLRMFDAFGITSKLFGLGTEADIDNLQVFLQEEKSSGRTVQAIWVEFPTNPNLMTPNITRLKELADEYNVVLVIDDTIGGWCNIDTSAVADVSITSLTKSFNGYADAIAGCAIVNPASRKYRDLKRLFDQKYVPELYEKDAEAIERNSRDYLRRCAAMNNNAAALVQYLHLCAADPNSAVKRVYYPSVNPSGVHYKRFMRPETSDFTPGFGCLFSVELVDVSAAQTFYDNLNVHKSVHFAAPFTLALPYTFCGFKKRLDWAAGFGLRPTQIRIAPGLEATDLLLEDLKIAVAAANECKQAA